MKKKPIRVLWFVNTTFPAVEKHLGKPEYLGTGWWMKATINELGKNDDLEIGVVWASNEIHKYERFVDDNSVYYLLPCRPRMIRKKNILKRISNRLRHIFYTFRTRNYANEISDCIRAINDFKPDLVHVWGTENFYGLISNQVDVPVLIRFQGLLNSIKQDFWGYWGEITWRDKFWMPHEMLYHLDTIKRAETEIEIIKQNKYFEGRTTWDYSHLREHNASAQYYDIPVMMRPLFYESRWSIEKITKHLVYTTSRSMPPKGIYCLVKAIGIVRKYVPDVQLRIGGQILDSGYGKFIKRKISELGLDDCIKFLGPVYEKDIINELLNAHVYVLASHIEGSCNSLVEAEMVGVPCVASYVGGVTSLITDEETGLFYPKGDSAMLALNIRRIFTDNALALHLSKKGREFALDRFGKDKIIRDILSTYRDILEQVNVKNNE